MTVPPKEIPEDPVVAIVVLIAPILTGTTLVTVNEAALIAVALLDPRVTEPAPASEETVRAPRGVTFPTLPKIELMPPVPEFKVRLFIFDVVPLMVLLKVIAAPAEETPAKVVSIVVSSVLVNVHRPYVVTSAPGVVIFPAMEADGLLGAVVEDP